MYVCICVTKAEYLCIGAFLFVFCNNGEKVFSSRTAYMLWYVYVSMHGFERICNNGM